MRRMKKLPVVAVTFVATLAVAVPGARADHQAPFDGPEHTYGQVVSFPMVFPVVGVNRYGQDFWANRAGGTDNVTCMLARFPESAGGTDWREELLRRMTSARAWWRPRDPE